VGKILPCGNGHWWYFEGQSILNGHVILNGSLFLAVRLLDFMENGNGTRIVHRKKKIIVGNKKVKERFFLLILIFEIDFNHKISFKLKMNTRPTPVRSKMAFFRFLKVSTQSLDFTVHTRLPQFT
jgi:hypothetical protein